MDIQLWKSSDYANTLRSFGNDYNGALEAIKSDAGIDYINMHTPTGLHLNLRRDVNNPVRFLHETIDGEDFQPDAGFEVTMDRFQMLADAVN